MAATISTLIMGNPDIDFVYRHWVNEKDFTLDTRELRDEALSLDLTDAVVVNGLADVIRRELKRLWAG
jgi:hypothetical protein